MLDTATTVIVVSFFFLEMYIYTSIFHLQKNLIATFNFCLKLFQLIQLETKLYRLTIAFMAVTYLALIFP